MHSAVEFIIDILLELALWLSLVLGFRIWVMVGLKVRFGVLYFTELHDDKWTFILMV